ncbi:hypothetical protein GPY61_30040 [Massilia sp. NEAU-DD11]|uniref:Uracil-DNA glycosylase-like domain-containing protein n=1 Tax=Massilia cellulosiltytica TaxID=2683234 RepID=A0A7X3G5U7_9BURK|nr:hypothetical protein [Telluria cellulosilytica]MVW64179.1 hypothetical protein [Telluria cellulosilytica]
MIDCNTFIIEAPNMDLQYGSPDRPIWLIGDSNPACANDLAHPLDPRHPSRHSIWTPVLHVIQERVFPRRLRAYGYDPDADALYIRNAVTDPLHRRDPKHVALQVDSLRDLYHQQQPILVLSFGAFAFSVCRHAFESDNTDSAGVIAAVPKLKVDRLADEFARRHLDRAIRLLPLLHQSAARSFQHVDRAYRAVGARTYFEFTGNSIAARLLEHESAPIWSAHP